MTDPLASWEGAQVVPRAGHWSPPLPSALPGWGASVITLDPLVSWARGPMGSDHVSRGRAVAGPGFPVSTRSRATPLPRIQSKRDLWAGCHLGNAQGGGAVHASMPSTSA